MDFKYNCYIPYYLEMESGIIPVPENSKDKYIVIKVFTGRRGLWHLNLYLKQ